MKNLLIVLAMTFVVFACHTKKDQDKSGINDPVNITYNSVDSSVISMPAQKEAKVAAPADTTSMCIDSTKIDPKAVCTQEVAPVCGCDGKEYSNQCQAEKAGVKSWTNGPCAGEKHKGKK